jgi:hypothetical protein
MRYKGIKQVVIILSVLAAVFGASYGIYCLASWIATPVPQPTAGQAWHEGFADAWSDQGFTDPPWGKMDCVTDWNGQGGFGETGGFSNGGPPVTHPITYTDQNTHSRLGNAWMAGCRAGLRSMNG